MLLSNRYLFLWCWCLVFQVVGGCGKSNSGGSPESVSVDVLEEEGGMAIVMQTIGQTTLSSLWHYDFSDGLVTNRYSGLDWDTIPRFLNNILWVFERSETLAFRSLGISTNEQGTSIAMEQASKGDPWDALHLSGSYYLLLHRIAGKIVVKSEDSVSEQRFTATDLGQNDFHPVAAFQGADGFVYVLDQGLHEGTYTDSQIMKFSWSNNQLIYEGVTLTMDASLPTGFLNISGNEVVVVGLCPVSVSGCLSGAYRVNVADATQTTLTLPADVFFHSEIISGEDSSSIFGTVHDGSTGLVSVVGMNLSSGVKEVIYSYSETSDKLYVLSYLSSAKTLVIGDEFEGVGKLVLISRAIGFERSFDFPGRPYKASRTVD